MFETELTVNRFLLNYANGLMKDLADESLAEQPVPGMNHPAWIIGHLAYTGDAVVALLGGEKALPGEWAKHYGPNSIVTSDRSQYPGKDELLQAFNSRFQAAHELFPNLDPAKMAARNPREHMREKLPTVGDLIAFILTGHMGIHLGQLSTWRRVQGIGRLF